MALAPLDLPNYRKARYVGDDLCVALDQLVERDQEITRDLYSVLTELLFAIVDPDTDDARKWRDVAGWAEDRRLNKIIDEVRELGVASHAESPGEELATAMHDVRGGAMSALLGRLQLLDRLPRDENQLKTLFVLTRDHLKIMRSAVVGLDDVRRDADRKHKSHDMRLMLDKWHDSVVGPKWRERPVRMTVDCRYEGALTECCLESAAIDRIFYNLANNACRHAVGGRIEMVVFPLPRSVDGVLRFVLSNEIGGEDAAFLRSRVATQGADSVDKGSSRSLLALFEAEVSSTGSGFGLTVVAQFVAGAFGLRNAREALRERYVGAILEEQTFRIWFHWPMANNAYPPKLDDFHQPDSSLSEP